MDYDSPIDQNDVFQLRGVVEEYKNIIDELNNKIRGLNDKEKELRIAFSEFSEIKDTLSWENKMIKLMSLGPYKIMCNDWADLKTNVTILNNKRQEIEERLKAYKKIFDVTPR